MAVQAAIKQLVRVEHLRKLFPVERGLFRTTYQFVHAVDDISFDIQYKEAFGLVGESGCGKTTTGKLLVKLLEPTSGHIYLWDKSRRPLLVAVDDQVIGTLVVDEASADDKRPYLRVREVIPAPGQPRAPLLRYSTRLQRRPGALRGLLRGLRMRGHSDEPQQLLWPDVTSLLEGHKLLEGQLDGRRVALGTPQALRSRGLKLGEDLLDQLSQLQYIDIAHLQDARLKAFRREVQMIFQDPYESLNPRMTIFDIVAEPLAVQKIGTITEREERVAEMLELVGLTPPESFLFRYPHELSGGQRQRVAVARAMVINPSFIVADEPTSMLDVSIRTGVMKLMKDLQQEFGISYLYITHDLAVARYMCERIAVMYLGKIVEMGPTEEVIQNPLHPYTKALIAAVPIPDPTFHRPPVELKGDIPSPINPPARCRFYDRCPIATEHCKTHDHPPLEDRGSGHYVACYEV